MKTKKSLALLFLLIFFNSCSLFKSRNKLTNEVPFSENIRRICLSGEGKGRMIGSKQKVFFSFEAINNREIKEWGLAFSIPLYGEEILRIDWSNPKSFKAKGKLVKRLFSNMGKNKSLMIQSFKTIVAFLNLHDVLQRKKDIECGETCSYAGHNVSILSSNDENLMIKMQKDDTNAPTLKVKAFDRDGFFRRLELDLLVDRPLLSLNLFFSDCSSIKNGSSHL